MRLGEFIVANRQQIISEWEDFARSLTAARTLELDDLRDHAESILMAIAQDLSHAETAEHRRAKAHGKADAGRKSESPAMSHGAARGLRGFTAQDVIAEYRALRASVLRMWSETRTDVDRSNLEDVNRFNEAIDQALTESIGRYLHDLEESKDLFLGILGHDLRNPLGAIIMSATAMITDDKPSEPHARRSSVILRSSLRMEQIIRDLLDFTRSHLGSGIPITRAEMDLAQLSQQMVDEISALHPHRVVQFEATGELRGSWDRDRIGQVLSNLLGNAVQHGSEDAPITVVLSGRPDEVTIAVHNWGPPIPAARFQEIFHPLNRVALDTSRARDLSSLGLGLYIAKEVAIAHGGRIEVESSAAQGTTFIVRLPRVAPAARHDAHVH